VKNRFDLLRRRVFQFLKLQHIAPVGPLGHFRFDVLRHKVVVFPELPAIAWSGPPDGSTFFAGTIGQSNAFEIVSRPLLKIKLLPF
jgi:hypothetical protein